MTKFVTELFFFPNRVDTEYGKVKTVRLAEQDLKATIHFRECHTVHWWKEIYPTFSTRAEQVAYHWNIWFAGRNPESFTYPLKWLQMILGMVQKKKQSITMKKEIINLVSWKLSKNKHTFSVPKSSLLPILYSKKKSPEKFTLAVKTVEHIITLAILEV